MKKLTLSGGLQLEISPILKGSTIPPNSEILRLPVQPRQKLAGFALVWHPRSPSPKEFTPMDRARFEETLEAIAANHGAAVNVKSQN